MQHRERSRLRNVQRLIFNALPHQKGPREEAFFCDHPFHLMLHPNEGI